MKMEDLRPQMVEAARKFIITPKVRESSVEEQNKFLLSKGVTEAEIDEARRSLPPEGTVEAAYAQHQYAPPGAYYPPPPQPQNSAIAMAQSAVVLGTAAYAGYRFVRSWVLPRFFDIPDPAAEEARQLQQQVTDLQNSIKFVIDSMSQSSRLLTEQQNQVSQALQSLYSRDIDVRRMENGISTIRSLLLSQHQFAAPVATQGIPDWQRGGIPTKEKDDSRDGFTTPPTNFDKQDFQEEDVDVAPNGSVDHVH